LDLKALVTKAIADASALPEDRMRLELIGRTLKPLDPPDIARFLELIYSDAGRTPASARVMAVLVDPSGLRGILGAELCREVYMEALELGLTRAARLLTDLPPHKKGLAGYDKEEEARMERLTLGDRRALSKGNVKDSLDRLLADPDPMVVQNILNNPRITEKEVLKIASRRPGSPRILRLVASHRRWSKNYAVRRAVAMNPYSPPRIAIGLIEFLLAQDLRLVAGDMTLHPQVRLTARDALKEREGPEKPEGE